MRDMFTNSQLSSQNYDKTLIGWAGLPNLQSGIELGAGSITFCLGEAARNTLTAAPLNWVIIDGGKNCSSDTDILSFTFEAQTAEAIIDAVNHTVSIEVANTAPITSLPLTLTLSSGASSNLANGTLIDFTNEVSILVTAADGTTTQEWSIVTTVVKPFITTWTIDSSDLSHSLTMTDGFAYNFSYVWKDAANAVVFSGTHTSAAGAFSTTFNTAGTYTLEIAGTFPHFNMGISSSLTRVKLADVKQWGDIAWQSMKDSFRNWQVGSAFTATDAPNLANVTDMSSMFEESVFNQDISAWNVEKVTNMRSMFFSSHFNQDIGGWNVENVTDMSFMFEESVFNQDIGAWNVENVTNMSFMFSNSQFNQDIGAWNVENVTNMSFMFSNSQFNQDLSGWNVSKVTTMKFMFKGSAFNQDLSGWNVEKVTDMSFMFADSAFNQNISTWNVSKVTTMSRMFNNSLFDQDISAWNVIKVTTMEDMFGDGVLSGQNYDKMLLAWSGLEVQNGVKLGVGTTAFCESEAFKNQLVDGSGWIITDGGRCSSDILSMTFEGELSLATVDKVNHTVSVEVSDTATITSLPLTLTLSPRATSIPANGTIIDFSGTVNVLVTAGDGTTQQWSIVTTAVKPFITTWNVAQGNADADVDAVTLNMTTGLAYNYNYIWKDVSGVAIPKDPGAIISAQIPSRLFISEFPSAGVYTLEIIGAFPHLSMDQDNIDQLIDVQQWGSIEWKSMKSSFKNWPVTGFTATDAPDLTNVTNMSFMFAESAFNQDLSAWNVSQISTMEAMFDGGVLSSQNYDKMLLAWSELPVKNLVKLGVGSTTFCLGEAARGILTATGWTITDGGKNCSSDTDILSMGFEGELAHATIDAVNHTVSIEVANTATITSLPLTLTLSSGAISNPVNGALIDFTNEVSILVTATDGTTQQWSIVTTVVNPFITTWTIDSSDLSHSLTMTDGFAYDFSYVWKDAANAVVSSGTHTSADGTFSTTFTTAGTYTLEIIGTFPHFKANFTNIQKLADVNQWGDIAWQSMNSSFKSWSGSAFTATDAPNLANVTDMTGMFAQSAFNQDINDWVVDNVTDMTGMFEDSSFNQDISLWDVSSVENMSFMFLQSDFNKDISIWNVEKVTNMSSLFEGSAFNQNIGGWNVKEVTDMSYMFRHTPFNHDISLWNVEKVTDMNSMFEGSAFNQNIGGWNVEEVTDMNSMFEGSAFNQNIGGWNVEEVTDMSFMFRDTPFNHDISLWNVGKVTSMHFMFKGSSFNQDLSGWNVGKVNIMSDMFTDSQLSSQNYDKTLIGWAGLPVLQGGVQLGAGSITYCLGEAARNTLSIGWTITDGGKNCSSATDILSFTLAAQTAEAIIDAVNHTVSIEVANTATITSLPLTLTLSPGASSNPVNGTLIDFTNEVSILVTAADGTTTQVWTVTVTQEEPALGIPEQEQLQVSVYPNPFEELVYIKAAKPFSISLNNMNGAHLRQENSEGELQLNLAGLSSGMYLLVIENEDGVTTKKLVKK
jgi:surface protein